jgi:hypothetical protein
VFIPKPNTTDFTTHDFSRIPLMLAGFAIMVIKVLITIIEYILATYSKDGKRLGDKLAKTQVIDLRPNQPGWLYFILGLILMIATFLAFHVKILNREKVAA